MFSSWFFTIQLMQIISASIPKCVARCEIVTMSTNVVPTAYRQCICDLMIEEGMLNLKNEQLKCASHYRSLKFRDESSGAVILHKAVVGTCSGLDNREYVHQKEFDQEEHEFLANRNFGFIEKSAVPSTRTHLEKDALFDSFRSNIMKLYKKPDGHLRFG